MPPFIIVNLALGAIALVLLLPLRSAVGALPKLLLGVCLGVVAGIVAINTTTSMLGMSRDSNIRPVVKNVLENADASKMQLLLVGSSYTALGVDGATIQAEMKRKGYGLQVLNLAKVGNFMVSQDYTIDYYLSRAKKVPEIIFIELGPEIYNDPGDMGPSYLNTGTAIADHAPSQVWWRARSIAAFGATPLERITKYGNLASHVLFHVFDFGLSGQLVAEKNIPSAPGFEPEDVPHTPLLKSELQPIEQAAAPLVSGALAPNEQFLIEFRKMQIQELKARGVKVVGFYQPVMTPLGMRIYALQICRELPDVPCIIGDAPEIRKQLDNTALWFDGVHLLRPGAELYSKWFADRLAAALTE